jgi:ClpP class serine protease
MNIISEITRGVFFMQPDVARQYYPLVLSLLTGKLIHGDDHRLKEADRQSECEIISKGSASPVTQPGSTLTDNPEAIAKNSIFSLSLVGPVTKYDQWCGPMGTRSKATLLKQADANPNIIAHILRIDSGGGEGYASQELASFLKALGKPVFAFVEGMAASAAYLIASACSMVAASSPMDRVGSIGTYVTLADYSRWYDMQGVRLVDVYAQASGDKNRDYLDAIAGNTQKVQQVVDTFNDFFLQAVRENRSESLDITSDDWSTGKMFFARDAQAIGLIDLVADFDDFVANVLDHISEPINH